MKKALLIILAVFGIAAAANAQERIKINDGLYLVSYGNTAVIEDEVNQRTISMTITKEINDRNSAEATYNVVCGKWTRRAVKDSLKTVIAAGIAATAATQGTSAMVSAAATLAMYIYDDVCDYYGE